MEYLLLLLGFLLLIKGADLFVEGSSNIAKFLKIPTIIIGLTLVAFGTSAPEAAVSIMASFQHSSDLSISNIIGSNLFNLFVVLGITALFKDVVTTKETIRKDYLFSIFSAFFLLLFIMIHYFLSGTLVLDRLGGFFLFCGFLFYFVSLVKHVDKKDKIVEYRAFSIKDIFFIVIGLFCVICGGNLTVHSSMQIAQNFGMSERLIGLTVVAIGTSLPELCTSLVALLKGEEEIAIGNVIGSNIFNILFILGMSSLVQPMVVNMESVIDVMLLLLGSIALLLFGLKDLKIDKKEGICMIIFYLVYCVYIVFR